MNCLADARCCFYRRIHRCYCLCKLLRRKRTRIVRCLYRNNVLCKRCRKCYDRRVILILKHSEYIMQPTTRKIDLKRIPKRLCCRRIVCTIHDDVRFLLNNRKTATPGGLLQSVPDLLLRKIISYPLQCPGCLQGK